MSNKIDEHNDLIIQNSQSDINDTISSQTSLEKNNDIYNEECELKDNTENNVLIHEPNDKKITVELSGRPIKMQRIVTLDKGPGNIPIIRDTTIIETEASFGRILHVIGIILVYSIVIQFLMTIWQRCHKKSCDIVNILVMFFFPPTLAFLCKKFIFLEMWIFYMSFIVFITSLALNRPVRRSTPRKIYLFFHKLFQIIYFSIASCQIGIVCSFFFKVRFGLGIFLYLFIISIYLGLLSSEVIKILSGKMAVNTGYYSEKGAPTRVLRENLCSLCGDEFYDDLKLPCEHSYHKACIKGWSFMAKREFCPLCRENIAVKDFITDKWMRGEIYFRNFLDIMRNFILVACFISMTFSYFSWLY
ncbi:RING finger protein [Dictyocoela muelleri]|nr:RING finger protein [Dictyocoela muelleri]